MSAALLDRPVWSALTNRQAHLAMGEGRARRFDPAIGPFAAAADMGPDSLAALAALIDPGHGIVTVEADDQPIPPGLEVVMTAPVAQMVLQALADARPIPDRIERLSAADAPEMLALATLTEPGPFRIRTHELGDFWGVKDDGRLVAMAGERFRVEGLTEVSGVCTHPDARGRGLAAALSHHVAARILARGETPFLHSWAANAPAIRLYERLGFAIRRDLTVTSLRRP